MLKNERRGKNGGSNRSPAKARKQGLIIIWMRAGRGDCRKAWTLLVDIERHFASPDAKVTCEQILALKIVVKSKSHASLFSGKEHDAGPLGYDRPMSHREVTHVVRSQVVEGGKLEREGADQRDQKKGQVGGDGVKWINCGLSEQASFNCDTTGRNCPARLFCGKEQ